MNPMMKKVTAFACAASAWVVVYCIIQVLLGTFLSPALGYHVLSEFWPPLIAPALIGLLGGKKEDQFQYYRVGSMGILYGLIFILLEVPLITLGNMVTSVSTIASLFVLLPIFFIVAANGILGAKFPKWFGGIAMITFNIAILAHPASNMDAVVLTISRLVTLWLGGMLFMAVEHAIMHKIMGVPAHAAESEDK